MFDVAEKSKTTIDTYFAQRTPGEVLHRVEIPALLYKRTIWAGILPYGHSVSPSVLAWGAWSELRLYLNRVQIGKIPLRFGDPADVLAGSNEDNSYTFVDGEAGLKFAVSNSIPNYTVRSATFAPLRLIVEADAAELVFQDFAADNSALFVSVLKVHSQNP